MTDDAAPGPRPRPSAGSPPAVTTTGSSTTSSTSSGALRSTALKPTTAAPAASFHPSIDVAGEATRVLCEMVGAVDARALGDRIGHLTHPEMLAVDEALTLVLDLP